MLKRSRWTAKMGWYCGKAKEGCYRYMGYSKHSQTARIIIIIHDLHVQDTFLVRDVPTSPVYTCGEICKGIRVCPEYHQAEIPPYKLDTLALSLHRQRNPSRLPCTDTDRASDSFVPEFGSQQKGWMKMLLLGAPLK